MHHLAQRIDVFTKVEIHRVIEHGASPPGGIGIIERLFSS
jgi:hypothetical protein